MKKIFKLFILLFVFLCVNVNAETCPYSEKHALNTEISHIKIKYDVKQGVYDETVVSGCDDEVCADIVYDYFDVSILNMSENFYVVITNNYDDTKLTKYFSDADEDGIIHFDHKAILEKVTYTFSFYASNETTCLGEKIKSYTKSFPRKNLYAAEGLCSEIPDADICQEYVYFDDIEYDNFYKIAEEEIENTTGGSTTTTSEETSFLDKVIDFVVDNKWYFIGGASGIAVVALVITFNKRRKQDEK